MEVIVWPLVRIGQLVKSVIAWPALHDVLYVFCFQHGLVLRHGGRDDAQLRIHLEVLITEQRPGVIHFCKGIAIRFGIVENAESGARGGCVEEDVALGTFLFAHRLEGCGKVSVCHAAHVHFFVGILPDGE